MQRGTSCTVTAWLIATGWLGLPSLMEGQGVVRSRASELKITGRAQTQFNTTSVDGEPGSEFLMRRVRLTAELDINEFVSGKVQPDFGEGGISLKDAYLRLSFSRAFRATIGQFKRPFDVFELTSSTQILAIERAGDVRGVGTCNGPGGVCSYSTFTEKLQYSDRDIGFMVDGRDRSGVFRYLVSITNGTGSNTDDENGSKSFTGRVELTPGSDLRIAANFAAHDFVNTVAATPGNEYAWAYGADVEWGNYNEGLHVQAGVVAGDNWRNLDALGDASSFNSVQGIFTYKKPIAGGTHVSAVEPLGRISWGDPASGVSADGGILLTPGFVVYFTGRNKFAINLDIWNPSTGNSETSLKVQSYLHF